jgi:hypothetical protein
MTIKKLSLVLAVVLAGGGAAMASTYDGDGNPVPGGYGWATVSDAYASAQIFRPATRGRVPAFTVGRDADGNPIPGARY